MNNRTRYVLMQHHVKQVLHRSILKSGFTVSVTETLDGTEPVKQKLLSLNLGHGLPSLMKKDKA